MFSNKARFLWRAWRYRLLIDPAEIKAIRKCLSAGQVAVDIGCHKGAYAYWMDREVGKTGQIYAFEPQKLLYRKLEKNIIELGMNSVRLHNMGLSSEPGELEIFIPGGGSSPEATLQPREDGEGERYLVEVTTLDHVLAQETRPVRLIKCDVEGHELEVFKGAEQTLRKHRPAVLFECEERHRLGGMKEVFTYLESLGYQGRFFLGRKQLPLARFSLDYQKQGIKPYANNFLFQVPN